MRLLSVVLVTSLASAGDLRVMCSPESLAANSLGIKTVGTWDCNWVNGLTTRVTVPIQAMYLAMPQLHVISPARAQIIINQANRNSWRSRTLRAIDYGSIIAMAVTGGGAVAASKLVVMGIGLGSNIVGKVAANLTAQQPDLAAFASDCPAVVNLDPGAGLTCTLYASKMKGAATIGPVTLASDAPHAAVPFLRPEELF